ncbi:MAG: putative toxin-antitoxin system toxin component, PIN family [Opitutaceae bacterium]|nr:putative toxin-antitoxin system toxin component, PIN family [Opitutaceae bacterium]
MVLDTCILFAALRSSAGASFRIVDSLPAKMFTPIVSTPLFFGYEEVLCRPRQFARLTRRDVDDFLDYFAAVSEFQRIDFLWRPFLPDPDDDLVLEVAVAGRADAIVTYNLKDFVGSDRLGVRIIRPQDFVKETRI